MAVEIRLRYLKFTNGLSWKTLDLPLDQQGLVLITGKNGSGKTSIAEILGHIFYEQTFKSGRKNSIVNRRARAKKQGFYGEVGLDRKEGDQWVSYRVVQARDFKPEPNGIRIWRGDSAEPLTPAKDPAAAQRMAADLLGMTWEEFRTSVYLPHRALHPLVIGTPSTRASYITQAYDLSLYDELLEKAKGERSAVAEKLGETDDIEAEIRQLEAQLHRMLPGKRLQKALDVKRGELESRQTSMEDIELRLARLVRRASDQERRERLEAQEKPEDDGKDPAQLRRQLKKLRDAHSELRGTLPKVREAEELQDDLKRLRRRWAEEPKPPSKKEAARLEKEYAKLEARFEILSDLEGLTHCPTCGQGLQGIKNSEEEVKGVREALKDVERRREQVAQQERTHREYLKARDEIARIRKRIKSAPHVSTTKVRDAMRKYDKAITHAEKQLERLIRIESHKTEIAALPRGSSKKTRRRISDLQDDKSILRKSVGKLEGEVAVLEETIERRAATEVDLKRAIKRLRSTDEARKRLRLLEGLVLAFGNKGLKLERMREIVKAIGERLTLYAADLLPRYKFKLAENESDINFDVTDRGVAADVASLSEGEKKRLSLALLLAERDIRNVTVNLLFLDEFDGGLDAEAQESLIDVLVNFRSVYGTIFAISHLPVAIDHEAFDLRYHVERLKHYSTLTKQGR